MKTSASLRWLALSLMTAGLIGPPPLPAAEAPGVAGYYRFPALHGDTIVFTAEGDLWRVSTKGGVAQRLTSHPGLEDHAAISPDGRTLAFSAQYEGPREVYTMPLEGGRPVRRTFEGGSATVSGWTPDGKIIYATPRYATLPDLQLATLDLKTGASELLPLSQAADGAVEAANRTLYFTRLPFQGSSTKRYQGGTAQSLWKFPLAGDSEATPLTADFPGTSKSPLPWQDRIVFVSDRDGTMNLWSMNASGGDRRQLTTHKGWEVKSPSLSQNRVVYQLGADLRLYDLAAKQDRPVPITLASDLDQEREKWVKKPLDYLTAAHLSPTGDRVALTARGQVFVAPVTPGRFAEASRRPGVRYRQAAFFPDGKSLLALSDASGELEFESLPANGVGAPVPLTSDGRVYRHEGELSPDGKWIAYHDKDQQLWLFNLAEKKSTRLAVSTVDRFTDLAWSPDSQWLAYVVPAENLYPQIWLYGLKTTNHTALTTARVSSFSPAWSPDGKWIYFLSERRLQSVVADPWGLRQPEPFFDKAAGLFLVSLRKDGRSPFAPNDELHPADAEKKKDDAPKEKPEEPAKPAEGKQDKAGETNAPPVVEIDLPGLAQRVQTVPVPPGNYSELAVNAKQLYWTARETTPEGKRSLQTLEISSEEPKPKTLVEEIKAYELSLDGKKLLIQKGDHFHVEDASAAAPLKLEKSVDLKSWTFPLDPREEWRQMFVESWRLMRDFFYDRKMHGVDWPAMLQKHRPLVERVTDRAELSDLIGDMVGELSALHIFVVGGDHREAPDQIKPGSLGAALARDEARGGYRVAHIYRADPDYPDQLSPLARPGVDVAEGDVIELINGVATLSVPEPGALLRNQAGRQVLLRVRAPQAEHAREVVVTPVDLSRDEDLRYDEWELTRRQRVEELGKGELGYVHLRAMGPDDIATWAREFYPVFNRQGLIVDVRHNRGGNIDSWILEKLLRKAWFFWQPRVGQPLWNMPFAFHGHLVVLCDERTGSDGEAFTEGFRRLGLGQAIGTRTWGGEIWLSFDNGLVDKGIASAAEIGVYGPEGKWLIEGHGVDPDVVVDNLPHATFNGEDAQLQAAIEQLQKKIRQQPVIVPPPPAYPDKSAK